MPVRRERSDAAAHRRLILETAQTLFSKHGVGGVSMHQIAKAAGIGQGTLYRRYAHKGDLCSDLMEETGLQLVNELERFMTEEGSPLSAAERFAGMLDRVVDFIDEKSQLLIPLHNVYVCEEDRAAFFRSPLYLRLKGHLARMFGEMKEEGFTSADPSFAAHILISSLNPGAYLHLRNEFGFSKEEIKRHYLSLYARG